MAVAMAIALLAFGAAWVLRGQDSMLEEAEIESRRREQSLLAAVELQQGTDGSVLQGTIGSSARKEFTVIGDAVNIAARLDALTKEREQSLLCSTDFGARLSAELREQLVDLGREPIRGRQTELGLLGC